MLFVKIKPRLCANLPKSIIGNNRRRYSVVAASRNAIEVASEPEAPRYPPIQDLSFKRRLRQTRENWADAVAKLPTVEEKLIKINMPRFYGWQSTIIHEGHIPYNSTEQIQYYTRTHLVDGPGLPAYYNDVITPEKLQATVNNLKEAIEDSLVFEYSRNQLENVDSTVKDTPREMDKIISNAVSRQMHRLIVNQLAADNPHLLETELDDHPRIEAFWFIGGMAPTKAIVEQRKKSYFPRDFTYEPVDFAIQYRGNPNFQLRHSLPLPEIISIDESTNPEFTIPKFKYQPIVTGFTTRKRVHGTNIPGFWPGTFAEFGQISYHSCDYLRTRREEFDDIKDCFKVQGILGSWGWLLSQACNLGFSIFNDVTYPLTNQMVITDGKHWSFCVYQLNTTIVHSHHIDENPRRNICWMTEPQQLFEKIEDGKVHGFNTEVLENLVKFYSNEPRKRVGVELKPYLRGPKVLANMTGKAKRDWLEKLYKYLCSNRPRHRRLPQIYDWQKIYCLDPTLRRLDKKREPWEYGINMWHRKLDDYKPTYIPKSLRSEKTKKAKFAITYYP